MARAVITYKCSFRSMTFTALATSSHNHTHTQAKLPLLAKVSFTPQTARVTIHSLTDLFRFPRTPIWSSVRNFQQDGEKCHILPRHRCRYGKFLGYGCPYGLLYRQQERVWFSGLPNHQGLLCCHQGTFHYHLQRRHSHLHGWIGFRKRHQPGSFRSLLW